MIDPIARLREWIDAAGGDARLEAIAMCLSTCGADNAPASRMVLLRGLDDRGLHFYTSYGSRKAQQMRGNPAAAALFYWPWIQRQVRIEGLVSEASAEESDEYFASRPRGHQLAAWASEQSEPLSSYDVLEERFAHFEQRFEREEVPRPHSWGGYILKPRYVEFWQGRPNRMHERTAYALDGERWRPTLLQP
jgi:pyridoxamine 5'-phosphate oxidase